MTYTHARRNLAKLIDETQANHEPIVINRQQKGSVVMMSLEDYNGLMETLHLLRSPRNAERLLRSIRQAERGEILIREPIDPDKHVWRTCWSRGPRMRGTSMSRGR